MAEFDEQAFVDALYGSVAPALAGRAELTASLLVATVAAAIVKADEFGALSGPQKKAVVLRVVDRIIAGTPAPADARAALQVAAAVLVPPMIDALVAAAKGAAAAAANRAGGCRACVVM